MRLGLLTLALLIGCGTVPLEERLAARNQALQNELIRLKREITEARLRQRRTEQGAKADGIEVSEDTGPAPAQLERLEQIRRELRAIRGNAEAETAGGASREDGARLLELLRSEKTIAGRLSGRIVDGSTGKLLPARVRILDRLDGVAGSAPGGVGFWSTGTFAVTVLAGPVRVEITAGPGYFPYQRIEYVHAGRERKIQVALRPGEALLQLRRRGWVSVDPHVVSGQGTPLTNWREPAVLMAATRAEGVGFAGVTPFGRQWRFAFDGPAEHVGFAGVTPLGRTGGAGPSAGDGRRLRAVELARLGVRGRMYTLDAEPQGGAMDTSGSPAASPAQENVVERAHGRLNAIGAGPETPEVSHARLSLGERAAREQSRGRLVILRHPTRYREADPQTEVLPFAPHLKGFYRGADLAAIGLAAELPLLFSAGGLVDALDLDLSRPQERKLWHFLLNAGHRIPAVHSRPETPAAPDVPHAGTYVRVAGAPTRQSVLDALRGGRSMVSEGPVIFLRIVGPSSNASDAENGRRGKDRRTGGAAGLAGPEISRPGDTRRAGAHLLTIIAEAYVEAHLRARVDRVEILRNGEVVFSQRATAGETALLIQGRIVQREWAWYVARVIQKIEGNGRSQTVERVAVTNPVYFDGRSAPALRGLRTRVTGRVVGPDGPLPARVQVWEGGRLTASHRAGADGRYALSCSPYARLVAESEGYRSQQRRVYPRTLADGLVRTIHCRVDGAGPESLWAAKTYGRARMGAGRASVNFALRLDSAPPP